MFFVKERIADKEIPTLRGKWVKQDARNDKRRVNNPLRLDSPPFLVYYLPIMRALSLKNSERN